MKKLFFACCLVVWPIAVPTDSAHSLLDEQAASLALDQISGERMLRDVERLSGDAYNGRQAGTPDDERAAQYIAEQLEGLSVLPITRLVMKKSPSITLTQIAPGASMVLQQEGQPPDGENALRVGPDYLPVLDSPSVHVHAPIVFVGYGIADPAHDFDEYAGVDVRDRVVLFLRGKPDKYAGTISHADKVRTAYEKGAAAYLTATGPILTAYEARRGLGGRPLAFYGSAATELPGAWIATDVADRLFADSADSLRTRQARLNQLFRASRDLPATIRLQWASTRAAASLHNVAYRVQGSDVALQQETVLVGAHRDHFGNQAGVLFAGADDNASGTAVLLEVARALAHSAFKPKRSIVFVSFTGEEQGLLGSTAYVRDPPLPLEQTKAMMNIDHAGIGNGRLTVGITGIDKSQAMAAGQRSGLADKLDLFGYFPGGDHVPFKEAGVPTVTIVSAGVHPYFHQALDQSHTINPDILNTAARYALALVFQLANAP